MDSQINDKVFKDKNRVIILYKEKYNKRNIKNNNKNNNRFLYVLTSIFNYFTLDIYLLSNILKHTY